MNLRGTSPHLSESSGYVGDARWTVTVTLRVWPDREDTNIEAEIDSLLRPIIDMGESMQIDVHDPKAVQHG